MKITYWLLVFFANLASLGWITAFAEPNVTNSLKPLEASTPPAGTKASSKLSGRAVYERISNETGGLYVFKPNPSAKDYREFLNNVFEKPSNGNNATEK